MNFSLMDHKVYSALEKLDISQAWNLVREEIGVQLFGDDLVATPFIQDADQYDIYTVLVKEKPSKIETLKRAPRTVRAVGPLKDVLKNKGNFASLVNTPVNVPKSFNPKYLYRISDVKDGVCKSIEVNIKNCLRYGVPTLEKSGKLVLDLKSPVLQGMKKLYIVTEACFATEVSVRLCIGKQEITKIFKGGEGEKGLPIGFIPMKHTADLETGVMSVKPSKDPKKIKSSNWMRPSAFRDPKSALPETPAMQVGLPPDPIPTKRNPRDALPALPQSGSSRQE